MSVPGGFQEFNADTASNLARQQASESPVFGPGAKLIFGVWSGMKWCVSGLLCGSKYHRGSAAALPGKLACSGTARY